MNKAVIMAGGFGTRLRPLTMEIPKPMVRIVNAPMMEHIVNLLKLHNINDIVSVLYFNPDVITSYFKDGNDFDINMEYVMANADYGTAGAVKNAQDYLKDSFIIISGDVLTDFDLSKAIEFHKNKNALATILLTRVPNPLQYGIVMTDQSGRISRFLEKPSWGQVFSDTINTGIYILEPALLDLIPYQEEFDFSKDLFPLMLENKLPLYGYIADGYWKDVGNLSEYQNGQNDSLNGKIKIQMKGQKKDNLYIGINSEIASNTKMDGLVVVGKNSSIGEHSEITNSTIGDNVSIGVGVKLSGVTIWDNVTIGDFSELTDDVICSDCTIGSKVNIAENVFIANSCTIGSKAILRSNIKLWPKKNVEEGATLSNSLVQSEKWHRELFTDARISGLSNVEIHPEFAAKLGAAIGMSYGPNVTFLVSRDSDKVSRILKRAMTAGLSSVGVNINDLQIVSIPQTRQELRTNKYLSGFHVRRSPRDTNKTDIIIFNKEGRDINISKTKAIERFFFGEDIKHVHHDDVGQIYYPERTNEIYENRYLNSLDVESIRKSRFKVLVDYSYGLASTILPYVLGKLNTQALSLHDYVDSSKFQPNSTTENINEAEQIMKSLSYELGFIIEPGAEKISVIDEEGNLYDQVRLLSIITKLFLETNKNKEPYKIAVSILATNEIEQIAKPYDVEVIRIKDTHSAMMDATKDNKVLFVGGIWGNYIFSDFLFAADGMYSIGKILEMLSNAKNKISDLDLELQKRYQYQVFVQCPWESKGKVMRKAMEHSDSLQRQLVDGVKIFINNDSVLIIPDKEKSSFLVLGESNELSKAKDIAETYSSNVSKWVEEI